MFSSVSPGVSRRALITGVGVGAVLLVASCTSDGETAATANTGAGVPPVVPTIDPIATMVATTRLHVLNLQAAVAIDTERAALLTQVLEDRQAHLDALLQEWARSDPDAAKAQAAISGQVPAPVDAEAAMAQVRLDAADARTQFTDALGSVSRHRAALFGSIASNVETHRVVLA